MAREISERCKECSSIPKFRTLSPKPECYNIKLCSRKRSYYRRHETNKRQQRERVQERKGKLDGCQVCGTDKELTVHHIVPISVGGVNTSKNTITLCLKCHQAIHAYYTIIGLMDHKVEWSRREKRI